MTINAKIDLSRLRKTLPEIKDQFTKDLGNPLTQAIEKDITKSVSPNKGKRFPRYSLGYSKAKKEAGHSRTVNLSLSGDMLKSLKAKFKKGRPLILEFTDEKAIFHNTTGPGGNKNKIRRVLPDKRGEEFNSKLTNLLSDVLRKTIFKIIAKNNM